MQVRTRKELVAVPFGVEMWSLYAMSLFGAPPPRRPALRKRPAR